MDELEKQRQIEYLTSEGGGLPPGITRHDAELRLQDDDLWLLIPELRYGLEGEDAVKQWEEAWEFVQGLYGLAMSSGLSNDALRQLLGDASARAEEALRRAQERVS